MQNRLLFLSVVLFINLIMSVSSSVAYEPPFMERAFGATDIIAVAGTGGLTLGVSDRGDITVLSWPSPSYFDQVHHVTSNAPDARVQHRMGAGPGMGVFCGLLLNFEDDSSQVTWLHDEDWTVEVKYFSEMTSVIESRFTSEQYGLVVVQYDMIPPGQDVLLRKVTIEKNPQNSVSAAWLLSYENFSPTLSRLPEIPLGGFAIEHKNDFIAVWNEQIKAVIHFHPGDTGIISRIGHILSPIVRDFGPLGELMKQSDVEPDDIEGFVSQLDEHYGEGVYIAVSTSPLPDQFQIGQDETDTCAAYDHFADNLLEFMAEGPPVPFPVGEDMLDLLRCGQWDPVESVRAAEEWEFYPEDAWLDAQDGELSGSILAGAQVNATLRTQFVFEDNIASATTIFAFGTTAQEAGANLEDARSREFNNIMDEVIEDDQAFVDLLWIPEEMTDEQRFFSIRAFLNIRTGTDRETGAIVASISRQPSYQLDWPRDGAFFNVALDIAGLSDLVDKRLDFYESVMRQNPVPPVPLIDQPVPGWPDNPGKDLFPPDSWEMNYYADGMVGGPIRLEIDNTALLIWAYVYHLGHVAPEDLNEAMERIWPVVERGAEFLTYWRDGETGLVWWANEDDRPIENI